MNPLSRHRSDVMIRFLAALSMLFLGLLTPLAAQDRDQALLEAVRAGEDDTVRLLLEQGADVNVRTRYNTTPIFFAVDRGNTAIVRLLLENGADLSIRDTFYNTTVIDWVSSDENLEMMRLLLTYGAEGKERLLRAAILNDKAEQVEMILAVGGLNDSTLSIARFVASRDGRTGIAAALEASGASPWPEPDVRLSESRLAALAGDYRNPDFGVRLTVSVAEKRLTGVIDGEGAVSYQPLSDSVFASIDISGIRLTMDPGDPAPGLTMHRGGRDFRFERVSGDAGTAEAPAPTEAPADTPQFHAQTPDAPRHLPGDITARPWPGFRGMGATGVADGQYPPTTWNAESGENLRWKVAIPGLAHSSPIVWGDDLFVTTAISSDTSAELRVGLYGDVKPDGDVSLHEWKVYALDRHSGAIRWERTAYRGVPQVKRHTKATQANSTPVTNGEVVVALFGAEGMYCYDMAGELKWKRNLGFLDAGWFFDPDYQWGHASSPIIFEDRVIVQCDRQNDSFIAAYALADGTELWRTAREEIPSWSTPTVVPGPAGPELVTNATNRIVAYDPATGSELWSLRGNSEIAVPTPFLAHGLIYVTSGYRPIQPIYAIRPGSRGDITLAEDQTRSDAIAWSTRKGGPYMPTPIVYGDDLYTCANNGVLTCYDARTGEQRYRTRMGGRGKGYAFTASPVAADGRLYFTSEDGEVYVVKAGPEFELLAINEVGDVCMATPAIADGMFYLRTQRFVMALGAGAP